MLARIGVLLFVLALAAPARAAPNYYDGYFLVNPIQVCDDAGITCADQRLYAQEAKKIYLQAATLPIFYNGPYYNSTATLDGRSGIAEVDKPGRGQSPYANVLNGFFVNTLGKGPDGTVAWGEGRVKGNGFVINASKVNAENGGLGRADTVSHEIGHNLGLDHTTLGAGAADNLMTRGADRTAPSGTADVTPNGKKLDTLTQDQIATIRASDFVTRLPDNKVYLADYGSFLQFRLELSDGIASNATTAPRRFLLDLSGTAARFTLGTSLSLVSSGVNLAGVTSMITDKLLQIDLPSTLFTFGTVGSLPPGFECTTACLADVPGAVTFNIGLTGGGDGLDGALAGFGFSTGFGVWSPIDGMSASSRFVSDTFLMPIEGGIGRLLGPGELGPRGTGTSEAALLAVPAPAGLPLLVPGLLALALSRRRRS